MVDVNSDSIWTVLLPVIVGGALPIIGVGLGPTIGYLLTSRSARHAKRVERFEEMISVLYQHDHWLEAERNGRVYGEGGSGTPPPIQRAIAISALYFPDFLESLRELDLSSEEYMIWMIGASQRRIGGQMQNINDGFADAFKPYRERFIRLQRMIADYAAKKKGYV